MEIREEIEDYLNSVNETERRLAFRLCISEPRAFSGVSLLLERDPSLIDPEGYNTIRVDLATPVTPEARELMPLTLGKDRLVHWEDHVFVEKVAQHVAHGVEDLYNARGDFWIVPPDKRKRFLSDALRKLTDPNTFHSQQ